jgi:hypothetical protein
MWHCQSFFQPCHLSLINGALPRPIVTFLWFVALFRYQLPLSLVSVQLPLSTAAFLWFPEHYRYHPSLLFSFRPVTAISRHFSSVS